MTLKEVKENAVGRLGYCKSCEICDGRACLNTIPGPGAKGSGFGAIKNYDAWKKIELEIDTIVENEELDTGCELFGKKLSLPIFAGPISNIRDHYSKMYQEQTYYDILVSGCKESGICAFTGDTKNVDVFNMTLKSIKDNKGHGIATIKPWSFDEALNRLHNAENAGAFAIAMDIDAIGLSSMQKEGAIVSSFSVDDLKRIISSVKVPFIVKGIMNIKTAKKAIEAGAQGIVVSNHGGRVLDEVPATCDVLKEIADFAKGKCKIFVDGGIRTGIDVFKALALGTDYVIIARPFVQVVFGDAEDGIATYVTSLKKELSEAMLMCGARKLSDINYEMIRFRKTSCKGGV